jgi:DNA-binding transcriptional MerR regulator
MATLLEPTEIERIEQQHATGLSARQIVEIFRPRGVRLSEATFRKYVQVGLLPRSRRIGRKGKHRGSQGLYPVGAVRRINVIKKMMDEGLTLEDIRRSFVYYRNEIEELERVLEGILVDYQRELGVRQLPRETRRELERALADARSDAGRMVRQIERIASRLVAGERPPAP